MAGHGSTAPPVVSGCDSLSLDASASLNPGGGGSLSYQWGCDGCTGVNPLGHAVITSLIRPVGSTASSSDGKFGTYLSVDGRSVIFDPIELTTGATYNFTLSVVSPAGRVSPTTVWRLVTKQSGAVPIVTVPFGASLSSTFSPSVTPSQCAVSGSTYSYQWTITPAVSGGVNAAGSGAAPVPYKQLPPVSF